MIKTYYDISIEINSSTYAIKVLEPNLSQKQTLENKAIAQKAKLDELESLNASLNKNELEINAKEALINTNIELVRQSGIIDKAKLLLENKGLINELTNLKQINNELKASINAKMSDASKDLESLMQDKAALLISGADKEGLFKAINELGISYSTLWAEISKEVTKAYEKK